MTNFALNERAAEIRWSKGSCGVSGCAEPECVCAEPECVCAEPECVCAEPECVCAEPECVCAEPECVCALCAQPIGIAEDDPRWADHDYESCTGCQLCEDHVPIILFRGEGRDMMRAAFHHRCFEKLLSPKGD